MPGVSIVIPLYNKGPHIARALNSALTQTLQDFEVIVVDDGSTDNGANIVMDFNDPRIRLVQQENMGVSAARNRGVYESTSDFIAFLDADDEWMSSHLETILRLRNMYPEAGMYATAYKINMPNRKTLRPCYKFISNAPWEGIIPNYFKSAALGDPPVCSSSVAIPKKIFIEVGGFSQAYCWGEDGDLWGKNWIEVSGCIQLEAGINIPLRCNKSC